jgi:hypothetical protein
MRTIVGSGTRHAAAAPTDTCALSRRRWLATHTLAIIGTWSSPGWAQEGGVVIAVVAHPRWSDPVDLALLGRMFTGRTVEIGGNTVLPCQLPPGHPARDKFLAVTLRQTEAEFRAYWTVRRHVGKGTPPREFASSSALMGHVAQTPGAIGYVPLAELSSGVRSLMRV